MKKTSMRAFWLILFGQMISSIGSELSDFALGIWVYQQTDSVMSFSLMALAGIIPHLLVAPFAGVVVDRWNRRLVMLVADFAHACFTAMILVLVYWDALQIWHLYIIAVLSSIAGTFQGPAQGALIPQLVERENLGRANGQMEMADSVSDLLSPLLAGVLLFWIGLPGVILVDFATFLVGAFTLWLARVPNLPAVSDLSDMSDAEEDEDDETSWWQEFLVGWQFIRQRPALLALMLYIALGVFLVSGVEMLVTPLALSITNEQMMGVILTVGGVGTLLGGFLMSTWGGPRRKIYGLLIFDLIAGIALIVAGIQPSVVVLMTAAFLYFVAQPIAQGSAQVIWQSTVPLHLQGRVFSTRDMLATVASPLAFVLSGPLADRVFEPAMREGGWLTPILGSWFGVGPGRGIGVMFTLMGLLFLIVNLLAWFSSKIRLVEESLQEMTLSGFPAAGVAAPVPSLQPVPVASTPMMAATPWLLYREVSAQRLLTTSLVTPTPLPVGSPWLSYREQMAKSGKPLPTAMVQAVAMADPGIASGSGIAFYPAAPPSAISAPSDNGKLYPMVRPTSVLASPISSSPVSSSKPGISLAGLAQTPLSWWRRWWLGVILALSLAALGYGLYDDLYPAEPSDPPLLQIAADGGTLPSSSLPTVITSLPIPVATLAPLVTVSVTAPIIVQWPLGEVQPLFPYDPQKARQESLEAVPQWLVIPRP